MSDRSKVLRWGPFLSAVKRGRAFPPNICGATPTILSRLCHFVRRIDDCWIGDLIGCMSLFLLIFVVVIMGGLILE